MNKLILIDGSSLLSSCFYATLGPDFYAAKTDEEKEKVYEKAMKTTNGEYTNGILPMIKMIKNLLIEQKPTHLAVAWDITRNTFRRKLYEDYKGTRPATPAPLKEQFKTMQDILFHMGIPQLMDVDHEADDMIGTVAQMHKGDANIFIYSKDQDVLQLVDDNVHAFLITSKADELNEKYNIDKNIFKMPPGTFTYTPFLVEAEYGIKPSQFADLKAILGDKSDNIPGVKGVGEKAAIPLIREYGTIENIYDEVEKSEETDKERIAFKSFLKDDLGISRSPVKKLLEQKKEAYLSKELALIKRDVKLSTEMTLDMLKVRINKEKAREQFVKYELKSLL